MVQYLVPALTGLLAAIVAASYFRSWWRLRHVPGPFLASLSYLWMVRICVSGKQAQRYKDVNKKYGPVARIGPNDLITSDPAVVRRMNGARSTYGRSSWYRAMRMDPYDESLFSMTDTAAHDRLKAKLSFGYGGKENPALEAGIDEQLDNLVSLIRRKYLSDKEKYTPMDLARKAQYFTLDAVTRIAYGKEFGYLETDSDVFGYIQAAEEQVPALVLLAELPALGRVFQVPWLLKLIGPKKTDKKGMGPMLAVAEQVVSERFREGAEDRRDMLGAFVRHGVSRRQCETEVLFQIIAGSDTTATAIRGTMLYLLTTRHAYEMLQKEIDDAVSAGKLSNPIKAEEGRQMEYLQAVIYEGLRLQIPFSGLVMKQTPPEGDTIDGVFIPGGTRIAHNTMAIQRDTAVFGDDAELFRPERWLGVSAEQRALMVNTVELVFGYGRWGCAGKPVAFIELNKIYVQLLRFFDFQLVDPMHPWHEANHNMFFQSNMWVKVTERV